MDNPERTNRPVAVWIATGLAMLIIQVILGGVTRLTGSGLSITEWNVVTGFLPPLTAEAWIHEFDKYRQTPQFQLLNVHFTISDFKFIFFWEWLHRFWARLIGIVFLAGFIYLVSTKRLKRDMLVPLIILFIFGALQGAVGWIMVASGLTGDAVYVKPTRLALHFVFAMVLIAYTCWFLLQLLVPRTDIVENRPLRRLTAGLLLLLTVQLVFGAMMAGHKAATAAPTWPDINGEYLPEFMMRLPFIRDVLENKITIHFIHRNLGYLVFAFTILFTLIALRIKTTSVTFRKLRTTPAALATCQVALGILALVVSPRIVPNQWGTFEWFAQLHQVVAMLLVLSLVAMLYLVRRSRV